MKKYADFSIDNMTNKDKKDKWQEFVDVASKEMANHITANFNHTVAMYLGNPCHKNFKVDFRNSNYHLFSNIYFLIFYEK